ncbi:hypothetical protein GCM10007872_20200 [Gluconobacter sphaericus NBRC 12467]|uniref:Antitoxin SocA-like Panacea domain-containing protein n=2 Tax=Gluconobacter sphaericus TaxID=574987 RepID=A0AA37SFX5_9PROT|nr:Panacea domain-containing protein [Gluconobacter sphaericus]MBF0885520.1 SocA family protein [Gluconobacter sphaericus]GBR56461.1 phage-associated protein [Gluconobacter sphaericus NBRC 12467]GEB42757.1 hypothetical protein GSP01_15390 [Gluconobacter sphaericus NBRC 12467]GLQ84733.1 hypothetical protein GCM10007872_16410 [Gluconobacter sphaericus NBRC 12467]GLQ85112.1 hypothetical protein GCM10007872_20200 [Gluconobacter sphaericus NBRC 12467]
MNSFSHSQSFALARAMCEARDWGISNLALQKSIYIADMVHMGRHGTPITSEKFEAWDYGPVLPSVYGRARIFGNSPVEDIFPDVGRLEGEALSVVREVAAFVSKFTPGQLVNMTHSPEGAWAKYYKPGYMHLFIPKEAEADEFRRRRAKEG